MRITTKLSTVTTIVAMSAMFLTPAHAETEITKPAPAVIETISSAHVKLSFDRSMVTTAPAPAPAPVRKAAVAVNAPAAPKPVLTLQPVPGPTATAPATAVPAVPATPTISPYVETVPSSGRGATIAAAALAQLGVLQDCTRLATKSLAAAGINFHGWPAGYLSLGSRVSAAQALPGDLIYYPNGGMGVAHIAVYIGGGKAVHGGWNGGTTAIASAFVGSGATFIRV